MSSKASKKEMSPLLNFNFSFDFDFDFDNSDEMSSMKKKVKGEEEIQKCFVNEEFSPLLKALHILKRGYEVQKKSVVSNLDSYIFSDYESNKELLPIILNSIDTWDTEFQCLLAQSLGRACDKNGTISADNLKKAIELCLDFVDNLNNQDVHSSWNTTFPSLAS
jgi:hypothetical protein